MLSEILLNERSGVSSDIIIDIQIPNNDDYDQKQQRLRKIKSDLKDSSSKVSSKRMKSKSRHPGDLSFSEQELKEGKNRDPYLNVLEEGSIEMIQDDGMALSLASSSRSDIPAIVRRSKKEKDNNSSSNGSSHAVSHSQHSRSRHSHQHSTSYLPTNKHQNDINSLSISDLLSMKKCDVEFVSFYLEFKDPTVETMFVKYYALTHSFPATCLLIALPYIALIVSIFAVNFGGTKVYITSYLTIHTVSLFIFLCFIGVYMYKLREICQDYDKLSPNYIDKLKAEGMEPIISNSQFNESFFEEIARRKDKYDIDINKATWLGRYAIIVEFCMLLVLTIWALGTPLTENCQDFCSNSVPILSVLFLWLVPFHMSYCSCIRWSSTITFEIISKLVILLAFFIKIGENSSPSRMIVPCVCMFMLWLGLWLPFLYSMNRKQLNDFRDSEIMLRVINFYKETNKDDRMSTKHNSVTNLWEPYNEGAYTEEEFVPINIPEQQQPLQQPLQQQQNAEKEPIVPPKSFTIFEDTPSSLLAEITATENDEIIDTSYQQV